MKKSNLLPLVSNHLSLLKMTTFGIHQTFHISCIKVEEKISAKIYILGYFSHGSIIDFFTGSS
jgi:hypothetical protein